MTQSMTYRGFSLIALGLAGALFCAAGDEKQIARAREILDLLLTGKHAEFCATGDETMLKAFDVARSRQVWAGIEFQIGNFKRINSTKEATLAGNEIVDFSCTFEKGNCVLRVILDQEGRMAGFWIPRIGSNLAYAPPDYVNRAAFHEEKVTVNAGEFPLPGTLSIPNGDGPFAGAVLVHGSGPHDQDETIIGNKPFRDLAWGLASRGVAVLRYEKRTHKYPTGVKAEDCTLEWETIDDALAGAKLLRGHSLIDARRVFVVGHSLGAMAAPFVAARDDRLAGIVLLAGNARSILDLIAEQTAYIANSDGELTDEEREQVALIADAVERIKAGDTGGAAKAAGLPGPYLARLHKLKPVETARGLSVPMLVMQGGRDYQVTTVDLDLWKQGLQGRRDTTFKLYDDLSHLFMTGTGKSTPAEYQKVGHVDARVIRDIADWIASTHLEKHKK